LPAAAAGLAIPAASSAQASDRDSFSRQRALSLTPGAGQSQTIGDAIVDQTGAGANAGSWSLVKDGAGQRS